MEPSTPGVYVQELPSDFHTIVGVETWIAAFVGSARAGPLNEATQIFAWTDYERLFGGLDGSEMGYAVQSFYLNGGGDAWIVRTAAADGAALLGDPIARTGINALGKFDSFNLLCLPDLIALAPAEHGMATTGAAAYCAGRRAFLILDLPAGTGTVSDAEHWATNQAPALDNDRSNAAAYWPQPVVPDPLGQAAPRPIAACGIMAGIYAQTDRDRGVWKAPAGIEAPIEGALGLTAQINDSQNGAINPLGLNALRSFPIYGILPWGARTLAGADALASEWKYVPVRRTALYIEESLYRGLQWTPFEPNAEPLWSAIRLSITAFLQELFQQGAMAGETPDQAYFVKCDATTTTPADVEAGIVNLIVGFAPISPAEFIVLAIQLAAQAPG